MLCVARVNSQLKPSNLNDAVVTASGMPYCLQSSHPFRYAERFRAFYEDVWPHIEDKFTGTKKYGKFKDVRLNLLGRRVCVKAYAQLLGMGFSTFRQHVQMLKAGIKCKVFVCPQT